MRMYAGVAAYQLGFQQWSTHDKERTAGGRLGNSQRTSVFVSCVVSPSDANSSPPSTSACSFSSFASTSESTKSESSGPNTSCSEAEGPGSDGMVSMLVVRESEREASCWCWIKAPPVMRLRSKAGPKGERCRAEQEAIEPVSEGEGQKHKQPNMAMPNGKCEMGKWK